MINYKSVELGCLRVSQLEVEEYIQGCSGDLQPGTVFVGQVVDQAGIIISSGTFLIVEIFFRGWNGFYPVNLANGKAIDSGSLKILKGGIPSVTVK
jgi:hypothetical protein